MLIPLILDRSRFLRVLGADPQRWAERFDLEPFSHPCVSCGAAQTTTVPFACGMLRGLVAPECTCGHPYPPYCVVSVADPLVVLSGDAGNR